MRTHCPTCRCDAVRGNAKEDVLTRKDTTSPATEFETAHGGTGSCAVLGVRRPVPSQINTSTSCVVPGCATIGARGPGSALHLRKPRQNLTHPLVFQAGDAHTGVKPLVRPAMRQWQRVHGVQDGCAHKVSGDPRAQVTDAGVVLRRNAERRGGRKLWRKRQRNTVNASTTHQARGT